MPWKETELMDLRAQFVTAYESHLFSMTTLCEEYGISRPTGYKWLRRHHDGGDQNLADQSRAHHRTPNRTPDDVVEALKESRRRHPLWGPRKIIAVLRRDNASVADRLPAASTAGDILKAAGLVPKRSRRSRPKHPGSSPVVSTEPNDVWYIDFKGEFRLQDGQLCYPLTLTDAMCRYLLNCTALPSTCHEGAKRAMQSLFERVGLPSTIRSDNGCPFCSAAIGGISRLSLWWTKLGILHDKSRPATPQDNGQHERMHKDLKAATAYPPAENMSRQQACFDTFREEFNHVRPHEALGMKTPASVWRPSSRTMPAILPEPVYPGHMSVRSVRHNGEFRFVGKQHFLSEVLARERIALEEVDDGIWSIYFYDRLLARFDQRTLKVVPAAPKIVAAQPTQQFHGA